MKRTKPSGEPKCPECKGTKFSEPQLVKWEIAPSADPLPHVKCLRCGTVSYLTKAKFSVNGWCGNPKEHFKEA